MISPLLLLPFFCAQTPMAEMRVDDISSFADYGHAVALSGDVALVAAPDDAVPENYRGSVYVFRRQGNQWLEEAKLIAPTGSYNQAFGHSIALEGDVAVIGAPALIAGGTVVPTAYIFRHGANGWILDAEIPGPEGMGWSVAIDGNRVLIGAFWARLPGLNWGGPNHAGKAFLYEYSGSTWTLSQELTASDKYNDDHFGAGVAIQGNSILIGATGEGEELWGPYAIGAVYAFDWNGSSFVETQKFRTANFEEYAAFGDAIAIDGQVAIIGAPGKNFSGQAYVFRRQGGLWVEGDSMKPAWPRYHGKYGYSVDIEGDLIAIAGRNRGTGSALDGSTDLWRFDGVDWNQEPSLHSPLSIDDYGIWGVSVSLDQGRALAGGWVPASGIWNQGTASLFDVTPQFHLMASPLPLISLDDGKFIVRNGQANAPAWLAYSLVGTGSFAIPGLGVTLGLANPTQLGAMMPASGIGKAQWELPIPASAAGLDVWLQALQNGQATNLIVANIQ